MGIVSAPQNLLGRALTIPVDGAGEVFEILQHEEQHEETWISGGSTDKLQSVLKPYATHQLHAYLVSKRVNSPENDTTDLLEEIDIGEQSGLNDFAG